MVLLTAIGMLIASLLPDSFYIFLFGEDFSGIGSILFFLLPGVSLFNLLLISGHYFSGTGDFSMNTKAVFIGFVVTIGGTALFYNNYTLYRSLLITSISYGVTSLWLFYLFMRKSGIPFTSMVDFRKDLEVLKTVFKKVK